MSDAQVNLAHARVAHQKKVMEQIVADGVCPFCREHFERYHTQPILHETEHWIVTKNFAPYEGTMHHLLFVAKQHCTTTDELSSDSWDNLQEVLTWAKEKFDLTGYTFLMRAGDTNYTGASVSHLHGQLVAGHRRESEKSQPILTSLGYKGESTQHE